MTARAPFGPVWLAAGLAAFGILAAALYAGSLSGRAPLGIETAGPTCSSCDARHQRLRAARPASSGAEE